MKKITKNIIMITLLVIMIGATVFTVYMKNVTTTSNKQNNTSDVSNTGNNQPPDMNNGNSSMQAPPDANSNSNDSNSSRPTPPNMNNNSNNNGNSSQPTPPDMNNKSGDSGSQTTPPDMNNNSSSNNGNSQMTPPDMNNETTTEAVTTPIYFYFIFAGEGLIIAIIIAYLLMSHFNKKNIKETFANNDKKVIYGLIVLILTGVITLGGSLLNIPNKNNNSNNGQSINTQSVSYKSVKELTKDETVKSEKLSSTTADENVISASGSISATLTDTTVTKTGDSSGGDNTSFYGINSAIIAKEGANLTIENATIETDATGANGVFSYGGSATTNNSSNDGTTITIKDSKITTKKDNSGGIMTTGGGTTKAENLTISTEGTSSAAIRSDRGGGKVTVNKGTYTTSGKGSPTIYSTADITVKNATLTSTSSEGVVIEGKNKVTLENVKLTDTNKTLNGQSTTYKNIFLYQSMSGDAADGSSSFTAKNSTITTNKGDSFYITNTTAEITLENNKIINNDKEGYFLRAQKDSWGNSGSNGGTVTLNMKNQTATGDIYIDEISTLNMSLKSKSSYTGTINKDNVAKEIKLTLDKNSKIKLTGDSYVSELDDADKTYSNIDFNGYKLYVNGKAINK